MALSGAQQASTYALSHVARSGATRSQYVSSQTFIYLGGPYVESDVEIDSLSITDALNETPNTCSFRLIGRTTTAGADVAIMLGSKNGRALFKGHVLTTNQSYWAKPANVRSDVQCVDYTWEFRFLKVTKAYPQGASASFIAFDLIVLYAAANGFTANNVQADLPFIPEMTFTQEDLGDAMSRICARIGGYWYVDYAKDVHLFLTEPTLPPLAPLVPTHRSFADIRLETDLSQVLTRVYCEGRGSRLLGPVTVGDDRIPLEAVDMFAYQPDVFAKVSFQGSSGGAQHLDFFQVTPGGEGSITGPGVAPGTKPTATLATGSGIEAGVHSYAYTWVTASGTTKPSPVASVTHGPAPATPTTATTATNVNGYAVDELSAGAWKPGDTVYWAYSWAVGTNPAGGTPISPLTSRVAVVDPDMWWHSPGQSAKGMQVTIPYSSDPAVKWVYIWHRVNAGSWRVWSSLYSNVPGGVSPAFVFDIPATYSYVATPPATGTATGQTALSGIAVGPASVTARKVYRTLAGGSQLKELATLANNTATTLADALADATLAANPNAPTNDTSALPSPPGQSLPGDTTMLVSSTGPFELGGGWAIVGNGEQVIRYLSLSGNLLTGIPVSGIGAIRSPISYGASITAAPMLTGIGASGAMRGITQPLVAGDEVYLVVQVDNGARAAQLAALVGGEGRREEWIQDRRLSIREARARCTATLAQRPLTATTLSYTSRDLNTRSGIDLDVNLPAPTAIVGTFKIQSVTIANFRPYPTQPPTFTVTASSALFSFEDLLRVATRDVTR